MTTERTIVVGDIHGCIEELEALAREVRLAPSDRLISVGDLVGKGPDGAAVVRWFRKNGHRAVLGNHDHKLLSWWRKETTKPLGPAHRRDAERMSKRDFEWLAALPLWLPVPEHDLIVVHGGIAPGVPLPQQSADLLLNLRSIAADGTPSRRVEGTPWASTWTGPELVVFGHDAIRGLQEWPHAVGLDTGCVYGGSLTALVFPERALVAVSAKRGYAERGASVGA